MIRCVDIFAGPGGLGEGFCSVTDRQGRSVFDVVLSVEKDSYAFETLKLRTFFRTFSGDASEDYYKCLQRQLSIPQLYDLHPEPAQRAQSRAWHAELGGQSTPVGMVQDRIDDALGGRTNWVLIGGPPCQAYSLAGRSRNRGNLQYDPAKDIRQKLYVEYLQILGDHQPAVFIMENVKGLLSATLKNEQMFRRILEDLQNPFDALKREHRKCRNKGLSGYRVYSLVTGQTLTEGDVQDSLIQAERYGVPQARHRVVLLGIRNDLSGAVPRTLTPQAVVALDQVLRGLPPVRSGLSREKDSGEIWARRLRGQRNQPWVIQGASEKGGKELSTAIRQVLRGLEPPEYDRGSEFVPADAPAEHLDRWFCDPRIRGVCNHSTRSHMLEDLCRYMYATCYAKVHGVSPTLQHFPEELLPDHISGSLAVHLGGNFNDRFRVQVSTRPATTIMSHIHKDGHYYIHPDPRQCRSLTVREAARAQTFPDSYFFCGPRTQQYVQVGNAVPPYLAKQIGEIVCDVLGQAGMCE